MDSARWPLLVKPAPMMAARASANRPAADAAMVAGWRARTACASTPRAPSPSSSPITAWMLSVAGPFAIALPRLRPWSAGGIVTYKLTYMPMAYSATISARTARLPRRTLASLVVAAVLTARAGDSAFRLICSPHCWLRRLPGMSSLAATRRAEDPARDRAPVLLVSAAEAAAQRPLFVAGDEQVEEDRHGAGVGQQPRRHEQPGLPRDNQDRGQVDRVAHPAVGASRDNPRRRVPRAGSATSHRREVPDAPRVQGRPGRDDGDRLPRRRGGGVPLPGQDPPRKPGSPQPWHHDGEHKVAHHQAERARHGRRRDQHGGPAQGAGPFHDCRGGQVETGPQRRAVTRADELLGEAGDLPAVTVPPGARIQRQQTAHPAAHDGAAAMRRSPISAMRTDSDSRSRSCSRPAGVIW